MSEQRINDCWNTIGIQGDTSCPELKRIFHCHNCTVFARAALLLFDKKLPEAYAREWAGHLAREKEAQVPKTLSVTLFRVENEWLCLQTQVIEEITEPGVIHRLPHRSNSVFRGLVNIHGKIQLCFSLGDLLGVEKAPDCADSISRKVFKRMVILAWEHQGWVFPADEIFGIQRCSEHDVAKAPDTVTRAFSTYTKGVLPWQGRHVGYLDHELLFSSLRRNFL